MSRMNVLLRLDKMGLNERLYAKGQDSEAAYEAANLLLSEFIGVHRYSGDYSVFTYIIEGKEFELWRNDDLGILHSIERTK